MNESVIIQKLIQVGQMLERGELEYSGAEIDTKHYLEQYLALHIHDVVGQSEQLPCPHCGQLEPCAGNSPETCYHSKVC